MNTLKIEAKLAEKYKYKPLPLDLSEKYRNYFKENIPVFLKIEGAEFVTLKTLKGSPLCDGYERIVIGDYGAFVEFTPNQGRLESFLVKRGEEYRINDPKYSVNVKYEWFTILDGSNIKIYKQKKGVTYAEYLPGMYYVSVHEVQIGD